jgi:DNA repair exonuclease SbcCD ATPase subunit
MRKTREDLLEEVEGLKEASEQDLRDIQRLSELNQVLQDIHDELKKDYATLYAGYIELKKTNETITSEKEMLRKEKADLLTNRKVLIDRLGSYYVMINSLNDNFSEDV